MKRPVRFPTSARTVALSWAMLDVPVLLSRQGMELDDVDPELVVVENKLTRELVEVAAVDAEEDVVAETEEGALPLGEGVCDMENTAAPATTEAASTATATMARFLAMPGRLVKRRLLANTRSKEAPSAFIGCEGRIRLTTSSRRIWAIRAPRWAGCPLVCLASRVD